MQETIITLAELKANSYDAEPVKFFVKHYGQQTTLADFCANNHPYQYVCWIVETLPKLQTAEMFEYFMSLHPDVDTVCRFLSHFRHLEPLKEVNLYLSMGISINKLIGYLQHNKGLQTPEVLERFKKLDDCTDIVLARLLKYCVRFQF